MCGGGGFDISLKRCGSSYANFLGFHSGAAEDSLPLRYDAVLVGNGIPTFRGNVVSSSSRVELPIDAASRPGRTASLTAGLFFQQE